MNRRRATSGYLTVRVLFLGFALAMGMLTAPGSAHALQPDEILADAELERRARALSLELRCLVCQNQSIDDSDAPLARDLRVLVRERLQEGDSDAEVRAYVVARYGDFVLLRPPFDTRTLILWIAPILVLLGAIVAAMRTFARRPTEAEAREGLSAEERRRLDAILRDGDTGDPEAETAQSAKPSDGRPAAG